MALLFLIHLIPNDKIFAADTMSTNLRPKVIMLELEQTEPVSLELFEAIRAQLSASQIRIYQLAISDSLVQQSVSAEIAANLSDLHGAQMLFWVEGTSDQSTVYFYNSLDNGGRIYTRVLNLQSESHSSRLEVIANAVSSFIEDSVGPRISPKSSPAPNNSQPPRSVTVPPRVAAKAERSELDISYVGSIFSEHKISHGIQIGLGFLPGTHGVIGVSFTQNLSLKWETNEYRFSILSRSISTAVAARFKKKWIEVRPGVQWTANIRSYSIDSLSETLYSRSTQTDAVHSLTPYISFLWALRGGFFIATDIGAGIALNERNYKISSNVNSNEMVARPFSIKPILQIGLIIQL